MSPCARRAVAPARSAGQRGFTLLEVLIVVTIVAILTAIAVPTYTESIRRANRSEARAMLVQIAQYMERLRTERNAYNPGGAVPSLPTGLLQLPASGSPRYTFSVTAATATTYAVQARAVGAMFDDVCGNLTLDSTGLRGFSGSGGTMARCWER